jgi:hypothetical protein
MAEKWRRTEDFYDYSELKDEKGNQNWSQTGFLRCKVIRGSEVVERIAVGGGIKKNRGWKNEHRILLRPTKLYQIAI